MSYYYTAYKSILFLIIFLPGFLINYFSASSMMIGLVYSCAIFLIFLFIKPSFVIDRLILYGICIVGVFICSHSLLIFYFNGDLYYSKLILSLILIVFLMLLSRYLCFFSAQIDEIRFHCLVRAGYRFFVIIALVSIFLISQGFLYRKSMILFSEPSHFALAFAPFYFYSVRTSTRPFVHFLLILMLAFLLKNLTLMVVFIMSTFVFINRPRVFMLYLCLVVLSVFLVYGYLGYDFSYFYDRLLITGESNNLSVLVFLSGYQEAYLRLYETYGVGIGFQQMGIDGFLNSLGHKLSIMGAEGLNQFDGGTFFSKFVVEFGGGGVSIILMYLIALPFVFKSFLGSNNCSQDLFYYSIFITFFIYIFVRGAGYFSTSFLLFLLSVYWLIKSRYIKSASCRV